MENTTTVAARIAALVRKHAPHNAKIEGLDKDVAEIAALAVASAKGFALDVSAPVTVEWFKLANRAEIKLTAETTMQLTMALAQARGRRVVLTFTSPDAVIGELPARPVTPTPLEQHIEEQKAAETAASRPPADKGNGAAASAVSQDFPELPKRLRRSKQKAEPKPEPQAQEAATTVAAEQRQEKPPEPWVPSVDEPGSYDPDQSPGVS